jgi:hypothetical protein
MTMMIYTRFLAFYLIPKKRGSIGEEFDDRIMRDIEIWNLGRNI